MIYIIKKKKRINFHKTTVHYEKKINIFTKIVFESKNKMYFCAVRINVHRKSLLSN